MATVFCVGHAVQDFVFSVDAMPDAAEKYRASAFESCGGGPAATAAVAVSRLGGRSLLAARTGDDVIGDTVVQELEAYGVDCSLVRRIADRTSSLSAVIVDSHGERMIVNYADPLIETTPNWLPEELPDDVDAVLCDTRWPEGAMYALELARQRGVPGVLDADLPVPPGSELVQAASHVAFSAAGLAEYSDDEDPERALRKAADSTDAWCGVTLGREGVRWLDDGELRAIGAFDVEVGDTLGAGDVWHGAFALALGEGRDVADAVTFAGAAAALKVANGHGRAGTPNRQDLDAFMCRHEPVQPS